MCPEAPTSEDPHAYGCASFVSGNAGPPTSRRIGQYGTSHAIRRAPVIPVLPMRLRISGRICMYLLYCTGNIWARCSRQSLGAVHLSWVIASVLGAGPTLMRSCGAVFFGVLLTCAVGLRERLCISRRCSSDHRGRHIGVAGVVVLVWRAPRDARARQMLFRCMAFLGMGLCIDRLCRR